MSKELKPCPFCGGEVAIHFNKYTKRYSIACGNPECNLCVQTIPCKTSEQTIEIWNRRADNGKL